MAKIRIDEESFPVSPNPSSGKHYLSFDTSDGHLKAQNSSGTVIDFNNGAAAITSLTGDGTASGPGAAVLTLATVNSNVGSFGSSTTIPTVTVNAKGLITAASGNVVIAPAGTLTGTTLNSTVVSSSLTSVGTVTSGTWNGSTIAVANGGTGQVTANAALNALLPSQGAHVGEFLTTNGTDASWSPNASGTVTSVALTVPGVIFNSPVSGSPITTSGTLALALNTQTANTVFAGPSSGGVATPTFRTLVSADVPLISLTTGVSGVLPIANGGTNSNTALNNNRVIQSSGGAIIEAAAITAARALKSDANGIPVASIASAADLDALSGTNTGDISLSVIGASSNANGASLSGQVLNLQPANVSFGGVVTTGTQSFAGAKTFTGTISASNLSGTNTGDQTITLTGDVTGSGTGSFTTAIAVGAVTDTKGSLAGKPACTVVATSNQTLSGTPTIDGQATASGSIILLSAQTSGSENGPWVAAAGAWSRPTWYPSGGTTQAFQFITTLIRLGTTYQGSVWRMTTAGAVTIDTTATTWVVTPHALNTSTVTGTLPIANGGTGNTTANAAFAALSPMTTNGDLITRSGGVPTRIGIGTTNQVLTVVAGAAAWASPSLYIVSTISSNTNAVAGTTYLCNTSGGAFTITLPAPSSGAFVAIKDKTGSFNTNNLTIARNASENIEGLSASKLLQTNWGAWSFFSDGTDWFMGPF